MVHLLHRLYGIDAPASNQTIGGCVPGIPGGVDASGQAPLQLPSLSFASSQFQLLRGVARYGMGDAIIENLYHVS